MKSRSNKLLWAALPSLILLLPAQPAHAGREGNGGHDIALEFQLLGSKAVMAVTAEASVYPRLVNVPLQLILSDAKIFVVQRELLVKVGEIVQASTAMNIPETNTILINRDRWLAIKNEPVKQALALHEVLGLAGIELTGDYTISNRYLRSLGIECKSGLCDSGVEANYGQMRFHAICHGMGKGLCVNPPDSAKAGDKYPVIGGGSCMAPHFDFVDLLEHHEEFDEEEFSCDAEAALRCKGFVKQKRIEDCSRRGQRNHSNPLAIAACIAKVDETPVAEIADVGIGTDNRCYKAEPGDE